MKHCSAAYAGNAIARGQDGSDHQVREEDRARHQGYNDGYEDCAAEEHARRDADSDVTVYREPGDN